MALEQEIAELSNNVRQLTELLTTITANTLAREVLSTVGPAQPAVAAGNTGSVSPVEHMLSSMPGDGTVSVTLQGQQVLEVTDVKKPFAGTPSATEPAPVTATVTATPAPASHSEITVATLRKAAVAYSAKHSREAAQAVIAQFGAGKLDGIDPAQFPAVLAALSTQD